MPVVAGVDSSTQSCTVELRDADTGALLGSGRAPHPRTTPPASEQPADAWWSALKAALPAAAANAGVGLSEIAALSVGAQCHGLVMLDADGAPLRPVKLWNDTTSAPQAERMVADLGVEGWVDAVGSAPTAAFTITKLAWVREHEPELLSRLARVLVPHDYLTFRLTGRAVTDRSDASGTGYYASHEARWRTDLLERYVSDRVDWALLLPEVLGPDTPTGTILPGVAAELGLSPSVVVGPGGGDQHLAAAGLGMRDGEVTYSLGTSGVVFTPTPDPVFDASGDVNGVSSVTGGYLPLVCTLNSTKVTDSMARWLGVDHGRLAELALTASDRAGLPVFAAFLDGERAPNRPAATGTLAGLTNDTTREELARAAFEGVLYGLVRGHELMQACGATGRGTVLVTGGGARSDAYRQLLADILGREVVVRDAPEATARGAAVQAAAILHGATVASVRDSWAPPTLTRREPRPGSAPVAQERYRAVAEWTGADGLPPTAR